MRRELVRAIVVGVAASTAHVAAADPPATAAPAEDGLAWRVPAECPDVADLRARVERRLGRSFDGAVLASVAVAIARDERGFVATIDVRANDDEARTLSSARCEDLADAVAVIVAGLADERAAAPAPASESVVAATAEASAPIRPRAWRIGVKLSTVGGIGVVPGIGAAGEVAAFARLGHGMLEIGAARWLASSALVELGTVQRVDVALATATARIGWRLDRVPLRGWLVGELGSMTGVGIAMTGSSSRAGAARWIAGGVGIGAETHVTRAVALVGSIEVLATAERARFQLSDGATLFDAGPVSARSAVGIEVGW